MLLPKDKRAFSPIRKRPCFAIHYIICFHKCQSFSRNNNGRKSFIQLLHTFHVCAPSYTFLTHRIPYSSQNLSSFSNTGQNGSSFPIARKKSLIECSKLSAFCFRFSRCVSFPSNILLINPLKSPGQCITLPFSSVQRIIPSAITISIGFIFPE